MCAASHGFRQSAGRTPPGQPAFHTASLADVLTHRVWPHTPHTADDPWRGAGGPGVPWASAQTQWPQIYYKEQETHSSCEHRPLTRASPWRERGRSPHPVTAPLGCLEEANWRCSEGQRSPESRPHLQQCLVSKGHDALKDDDVGAIERLLQREGAVLVPVRIQEAPQPQPVGLPSPSCGCEW